VVAVLNSALTLFEFLHRIDVQIRAAHIPGIINLHVGILPCPDKVYTTEWASDKSVFRWLCAKSIFDPEIVVFATSMQVHRGGVVV
jgi:hypothetical protein